MKRIFTLALLVCITLSGFAQIDSTQKKADTIVVGGMIIIRDSDRVDSVDKKEKIITIRNRRKSDKPSNISTNWFIVDLGFSNWVDNTNYADPATQAFAPGSSEDWMELRTGKSRNVNLWFFMQRINLVKHVVNLKYGVGLELNNYHFENESIQFHKSPTMITDGYAGKSLEKNKLAADYLTVPMMLHFNFTPGRERNFGIAGGISAGYLYSARQKIKDGDIDKLKGNLGLEKWKLAYIGEISLGPVKLYGSYAMKNMFSKGLDLTPYNVGFRISAW